MTTLHPSVAAATHAFLDLSAALYEASDAQWQRSIVLASDDDADAGLGGSLQSRGQHSDPTFDTVADERRRALREAVVSATRLAASTIGRLQALTADLQAANNRLHSAMDKWNGGL